MRSILRRPDGTHRAAPWLMAAFAVLMAPAYAQQQTDGAQTHAEAAQAPRPVVVIDPARGGAQSGARLPGGGTEKEAVLELGFRLRLLLRARGFDVVLTRDNDTEVVNEQRAAAANGAHATACLLLHASAAGKGAHLYTSALPAQPSGASTPWREAQAPFVAQSQRLADQLSSALARSQLPVSTGQTWTYPLDNMQCPAVALELAPSAQGRPPSNPDYQAEVAEAVAGALLAWRGAYAGAGQP